MATRLQDVAVHAGVSVKTVSNVVNGTGHVRATTKRRVQESVTLLQYRPNASARNLKGGRSGIIAVALPELSQPYFAELASELVRQAQASSLTVLVNQTDGIAANERSISEGVGMPLLGGLIISPLGLRAEDFRNRQDKAPLVLLGEHVADEAYAHVTIDNLAAATDAVQYLLSCGRTRIAAIGAQTTVPNETATLRLSAYRAALQSAGLEVRPEWIRYVRDFHRSDGAHAMQELLRGKDVPDAVFCFNDMLALGALRELRAQGIRVPEEMAVVGIDDVEEGRFAFPSLTTVAPNKEQIAREAINLIQEQQVGQPPRAVIVNHRIIARESTPQLPIS